MKTSSTRRAAERGTPESNGTAARPAPDARDDIIVSPDQHIVNDQAEKALAGDPEVYQRAGELVAVVSDGERKRIVPLTINSIRDRLARNARFISRHKSKHSEERKRLHPPSWCGGALLDRGEYRHIRRLAGLVDHPVLRPNGSILEEPGYDAATGLIYTPAGPVGAVPQHPTKADAVDAARELLSAVADFPFARPMHQSAWLAALLTPLARFAFDGPAPLFLADANARGVGKGLLFQVIAHILSGKPFPVSSYTDDESEFRKHITSVARGGDRFVLLDNVEGKFGNSTLDRALTATTWEDRLLGQNKKVSFPLAATWYATGNNLSLAADTARRICQIRLECGDEHPELRKGFAHPELLSWVKSERPRLLRAALTILAAYCHAGRPDQDLSPWGSFEGWSGWVRAAVKWAGQSDPGETRQFLRDQSDLVHQNMCLLLRRWQELDRDGKGLTVGEVIDRVTPGPNGSPSATLNDMRAAIEHLCGKVDAVKLGQLLAGKKRRNFGGLFIDRAGKEHNAVRWVVKPQDEF
ncbi:MAG TPA: hypothetical protein VFA26_13410 [Gemmataceae bacterium]|nr:hypothetical protein [Gemmataceae bacterium]